MTHGHTVCDKIRVRRTELSKLIEVSGYAIHNNNRDKMSPTLIPSLSTSITGFQCIGHPFHHPKFGPVEPWTQEQELVKHCHDTTTVLLRVPPFSFLTPMFHLRLVRPQRGPKYAPSFLDTGLFL